MRDGNTRRPDHLVSVITLRTHKILIAEPGQHVLAKLTKKKKKTSVSLLISEQLQPTLVYSLRSDPFLLLSTLSICFYPDSIGYVSMVTRATMGKQIKATGSAYSGTLTLPSARVTTACMHNFQINRKLKKAFL